MDRATTLEGRLGRMAPPDQITARINSVALGIPGRGQAVGINDQGPGPEASRSRTRPVGTTPFEPAGLKTPALKTPPLEAASLGAATLGASTAIRASALGPSLKATARTAVVGLALSNRALAEGTVGREALCRTTIRPAVAIGTVTVPTALERPPFTPAAGALGTGIAAGLVAGDAAGCRGSGFTPGVAGSLTAFTGTIAAPFRFGTAEAGWASSPAAAAPHPLVRTAFKSWAHGVVFRRLWIVLLQVI